MTKTEIYRTAIAAVICCDGLDMEDKIEVLRLLYAEESVADRVERVTRSEITEEMTR